MVESFVALAIAFGLSLFGTKIAHPVGHRLGLIDKPGGRKVHLSPLPRSGGLLLIPSIVAALYLAEWFIPDNRLAVILQDPIMAYVGVGLAVIYVLGVLDDRFDLPPLIKLGGQIVAVAIPIWGGMDIQTFNLFSVTVDMTSTPVSTVATALWCLLLINAINLIDGLDGLAAGLILFTSLVITGLALAEGRVEVAVFFSVMIGAMAGFLVYNFNPASIFLGDCGSCSLGYIVGTMSLITETKSQLGTSLAIPLITLGIPLFDAIMSGVRRFALGRNPFAADKGHIHHRLLKLGLTQKRAVVVLYGMTVLFAGLSLLAFAGTQQVNAAALAILFLMLALIWRRLNYFEALAIDRVYGWLRDVVDVTGISHTRRSFLGLQHAIAHAEDLDEVWTTLCQALEFISMDYAEASLCVSPEDRYPMGDNCSVSDLKLGGLTCPPQEDSVVRDIAVYSWNSEGFDLEREQRGRGLMKMECPLVGQGLSWGTLWLVKDLRSRNLNQFTLRRIEQLRRTLIAKMNDLHGIES